MADNAPAAWRSGGLSALQPELPKAVNGRGSTSDSAPTAIAPNRLLCAVCPDVERALATLKNKPAITEIHYAQIISINVKVYSSNISP